MENEQPIPFPSEALLLLQLLESQVPLLQEEAFTSLRALDYTKAHEIAGKLEQIQELRQWYEDTMEDIRAAAAHASQH